MATAGVPAKGAADQSVTRLGDRHASERDFLILDSCRSGADANAIGKEFFDDAEHARSLSADGPGANWC